MLLEEPGVQRPGRERRVGGDPPVEREVGLDPLHGERLQRGAVVALLLLTPAVLTFVVDWSIQRRQTAMLGARAVPYRPKPSRGFDAAMTLYCVLIGALMLAMLGMALRAVGVGAAIVVLFILRRLDSFTNPQFWAEDATVLFLENLTLGCAGALRTFDSERLPLAARRASVSAFERLPRLRAAHTSRSRSADWNSA